MGRQRRLAAGFLLVERTRRFAVPNGDLQPLISEGCKMAPGHASCLSW